MAQKRCIDPPGPSNRVSLERSPIFEGNLRFQAQKGGHVGTSDVHKETLKTVRYLLFEVHRDLKAKLERAPFDCQRDMPGSNLLLQIEKIGEGSTPKSWHKGGSCEFAGEYGPCFCSWEPPT